MRCLVVVFSLLIGATLSFGQISFYKQFSNNGYDYGEGIVQTEDSSYLITGQSSSFIDGPADAFILKVDKHGNFLWSNHYGGDEIDGGKRIMYIKNDGILVAGFTNSTGAGAYDFNLIKTDVNGNELWNKTYGTASWDRVLDAALTSDSGVIMIGQTLNTADGESDILIVRTDKNGEEVWSQQIGGPGEDLVNAIESVNDSTFVIVGGVYVSDSSLTKGYILYIEDNGTVISEDTIGTYGNYELIDIEFILSEINVVGRNSLPGNDWKNYYAKILLDGTLVFETTENQPGIANMVGVSHSGTANDFLFVSTKNNSMSYGGFDLGVYNFAYPLYYTNLQAAVNYAGDQVLGKIIRTLDAGAVLVGTNLSMTPGGANVFIMKIADGAPYFSSNDDFSTNSLVSIFEQTTTIGIEVYPNPVASILKLGMNDVNELKSISITDLQGRTIMECANSDSNQINVSDFENGTYILNLRFKNGKSGSTKIMVKH